MIIWQCFVDHINVLPCHCGYTPEKKLKLYNEIINQQDSKPIDIERNI